MRKSARNACRTAKTHAIRRPIYRGDRGSSGASRGHSERRSAALRPIPRSGRTARPPHAPGRVRCPPAGVEQEDRT
ncbi:hypothetical protein C6Q22_10470 [Burkholderia multivorans]|nr:hypothetical protein BURMUCGD1_2275 [Burkholderia multivorans CGD1]PRE61366.1 hypothetical protein C6P86_22605 [Burkholderia multivorans]PRE79046.1 hypothetical protein C6Q00_24815 [Burkholderia multivorans]PRF37415.1 hypothetical protein C6Q08_05480 [Burkholderia multivorans]PRF89125.1 hypothetical protein C6Q22_10470 [Burkholderia multivorans]